MKATARVRQSTKQQKGNDRDDDTSTKKLEVVLLLQVEFLKVKCQKEVLYGVIFIIQKI